MVSMATILGCTKKVDNFQKPQNFQNSYISNGCLCEKNKNHLTNMSQNLNIVANN